MILSPATLRPMAWTTCSQVKQYCSLVPVAVAPLAQWPWQPLRPSSCVCRTALWILFLLLSHPARPTSPSPPAAVAATRADDELSGFSNRGRTSVHLAAPGVNILSTSNSADSSYEYMSGTSMATPVVSGAAALLFSANPTATVAQVRWGRRRGEARAGVRGCANLGQSRLASAALAPNISTPRRRSALLSSVDHVPELVGQVVTGGRLNVANALAALLGKPAPPRLPAPQCEPTTGSKRPSRCLRLGFFANLSGACSAEGALPPRFPLPFPFLQTL